MSDAPELIWAWRERDPETDKLWDAGSWITEDVGLDGDETEYIRADRVRVTGFEDKAKVKPLSDAEISRARTIIINESGGYWHPDNDMVRRILSALE